MSDVLHISILVLMYNGAKEVSEAVRIGPRLPVAGVIHSGDDL